MESAMEIRKYDERGGGDDKRKKKGRSGRR